MTNQSQGTQPSIEDHPFLQPFKEYDLKKRPLSFLYRIGIFFITLTTIILPFIYLALCLLIAWRTWYYMNHGPAVEDSGSVGGHGLLYIAPILVGIIAIVFMIKPLFARHKDHYHPYRISRESEPLMFEFIEWLCDSIGAPMPARIEVTCEVNASAGFRRGLLSFFGNDMVLTIGLPLATAFNLRQFTGVLAHEFGHFSQGASMRLTFIVRSINNWFYRLVYERDEWDDKLEQLAGVNSHWIRLIANGARAFVWLNRRILWGLMMLGHMVSSFMLRQMELDADRCAVDTVGAEVYADALRKLPLLAVASHMTIQDLQESWKDQRLCDNMMALIAYNYHNLPDDVVKKLTTSQSHQKTHLFDTHPSDRQRIEQILSYHSDGLFHFQEPASQLFRNLDRLSREVTKDFYRDQVGLNVTGENLIPTDAYLSDQNSQKEDFNAYRRFFQNLIRIHNPVTLESSRIHTTQDIERTSLKLLNLRNEIQAQIEDATAAGKKINVLRGELARFKFAKSMLDNNIRINADKFHLTSATSAAAFEAICVTQEQIELTSKPMDHIAHLMSQRLILGLELLLHPDVRKELQLNPDWHSVITRMLKSLPPLTREFPRLIDLQFTQFQAISFYNILQQNPQAGNIYQILESSSANTRLTLQAVLDKFEKVEYPFEHAGGPTTILGYATSTLSDDHHFMAVFPNTEEVIDKLMTLYYRILGRLASLTEKIETNLGLAPFQMPVENENPDEESASDNKAAPA